ncbi:MAG: TIGR03905 family TSCPD domain-containing protein [Clostridiales bacterium]|nr:TIGR03905 family TSCPD domain-containing protein [Clostridiales bacterium]
MQYSYKTNGTCASVITFDIEGDIIKNVKFTGGCNGNLKAISALVEGMKVSEIEDKLKGITCGWKNTSCSDQLTKAVRKAYEENKGE